MKNKDFHKYGHKLVDWMSNYFKEIENYPIKPNVKPGDIYKQFPSKAPLNKESFETIFKRVQIHKKSSRAPPSLLL